MQVLDLMRMDNKIEDLARRVEQVRFDAENLVSTRVNEMLNRLSQVDDQAYQAFNKAKTADVRISQFGDFVKNVDARIRTIQKEH